MKALSDLFAVLTRQAAPAPVVIILLQGQETEMTVPASIQAFCAELETRVPAAIAAAVAADRAAQEPAIQARIDAAIQTAEAGVVQDDSDGAAALETSLNAVAPVAVGS